MALASVDTASFGSVVASVYGERFDNMPPVDITDCGKESCPSIDRAAMQAGQLSGKILAEHIALEIRLLARIIQHEGGTAEEILRSLLQEAAEDNGQG